MSAHFTYKTPIEKKHLKQGDLLEKNDDICLILKEVHPHYLKPDYKYFIVLTQSCDLLRRNGAPPKARYISIAAVRPFDTVLSRELSGLQGDQIEIDGGICDSTKRSTLYQFIEKILNNNHLDYFYLHEDQEQGLSESYCAFLRLSIAIKSIDHYEQCLNSKFMELTEEFRGKLGWLVGNLYSRIGTMDWTPDFKTPSEFREIISDILQKKVLWLEKDSIKLIKKYIKDNNICEGDLQQDAIRKMAESITLPTKEEKKISVLNRIKNILETSNVLIDGVNIDKLLKKIGSDPVFSGHIK